MKVALYLSRGAGIIGGDRSVFDLFFLLQGRIMWTTNIELGIQAEPRPEAFAERMNVLTQTPTRAVRVG